MRWRPQVVALSEFRDTAPSQWLAQELKLNGYIHQRQAPGTIEAKRNRVFVASKYPLRRVTTKAAPTEPGRWLMVSVACEPGLLLGAMHIPNQVTGRKPDYHRGVLNVAKHWQARPALLVGDTNSGRIGIDEQTPVFNRSTDEWFVKLATLGWADAFRAHQGDKREYTWYSPNKGNGFRLDQAFLSRPLHHRVTHIRHEWGADVPSPSKREALSDHAALILDLT